MTPFLLRNLVTTVAPYTLFGILWIWLSDSLLAWIVQEPERITQLSIYKGSAFIAITSFLLAVLVWRSMRSMRELENRLTARQAELDEFIYATSHHLRGPLVNIEVSAGEIAADLAGGDEVSRDTYAALLQGVRKGVREIDVLLAGLGRLHRALRERPEPRRVLPEAVLQERIVYCQARYCASQSVRLSLAEIPAVWVDPRQFETLVTEILDNVFRHHDAVRSLDLRISGIRSRRKVRILFQDNGPGFETTTGKQLFEPILRHPSGDDVGALRVGLAIAWRCARWNGGDLEVRSQLGIGTEVTVVLPAA